MEKRLFLSYTRDDEHDVIAIREVLQEWGFRVLIKPSPDGQDAKGETRKKIGDSHLVIICISSRSVNEEGVIHEELLEALEICNDVGYEPTFLVAVRLDKCTIPDSLRGVVNVDFFQKSGKNSLFSTIKKAGGAGFNLVDEIKLPKTPRPHGRPMRKSASLDREATELLGIINCVQQLEDSKWGPGGCGVRARRSLKVCGLQGSKWVDADETYEGFKECLNRLSRLRDGRVEFLLINPLSASLSKIKQKTQSTSDREHDQRLLEKYYELTKEFSKVMEVKLYDHFPYFRIVVIDEIEMAVSRYNISGSRKEGWKAPHLILKNDDEPGKAEASSLFFAFERYFDHVWDSLSHPIEEIITQMRNPVSVS